MPITLRGPRKAMRGKCERGQGSANADGAGAKVFAGDGCSQGRLSAPWPRFHGVDRADVYIIIRVRACCCGECALNPPTSPPISPPKPSARPRTATRPSRTLPLPHAAPTHAHAVPTHARRLRDARPPTSQPTPRRRPPLAPAAPTHARRLRDAFSADRTTHSPPKPFARPRTATRPRRALPPPTQPDARPQAARCTPADLTTHSRRRPSPTPAQQHALPEHLRSPTQPRRTPAGCAMHSPPTAQPFPRSATLPPLPFRFGHKKTAPHSACAMPNVSVDRRCGRSFGLVSRTLFAAVAGRWRVGVGLRPQPWALRSRRCGRVLRA